MIPHIPQQKVQIEHFMQGCVCFMNYFVARSHNHKKENMNVEVHIFFFFC